MPLTIKIPGRELWDEKNGRFIEIKPQSITLEHSLLSISKWESKWHKPYLSKEQKTREEAIDYIRCMTIDGKTDPNVYYGLTANNLKEIEEYIKNPMTGTTFSNMKDRPSREIVTSEIIYYWMVTLNIPFSPCEKWHFNRLLTLIQVTSIKNKPPKKMSKADTFRRNHSLNAARRAKYGTKG